MRFTLPSLRPVMPRPRLPLPPAEPIDVPGELPESASRLSWRSARRARPSAPTARGAGWTSRHRTLTGIVGAGAAVVLLCFGVGWGTNVDQVRLGRGSGSVSAGGTAAGQAAEDLVAARRTAEAKAAARRVAEAKVAEEQAEARRSAEAKAAEERAAAQRAADDKALAAKLLAAKAADARAAEARAAEARAADRAHAREEIVMPGLVGLGLASALDVAARAGLTDVTVCHAPEEPPTPRSEWRVTGQDVAAGVRIGASRRVCLAATGPQLIKDSVR
ncbi:PASTA domain-containing protein [Actinoplanes sp. NPDC004185]